ncbi:ubiquinol-cytochrome c reductase iron-sulfur subunit [Formicincola oecophyllae]|uniref:Ubiquinol-cytochrome c reductase iron-sulfur subunit n=1 Tax=Formicincola oecophyllae TaxID=2558361 RepID=A0A4Y6UA90_9PROT|nr:ubiquinol-cytochrome c reductase iron-sulfur subunit [Formicincola oecophyllae]QDH13291.1 ubiquinol-cytochrome c reductase iron-sulfur subunit [Formicincola oecophyllae]
MTDSDSPPYHQDNPTDGHYGRRRVLGTAAGVVGCAGLCAASWPFLDSLNGPHSAKGRQTTFEPLDIDLSNLAPGSHRQLTWGNLPVAVTHRTKEQIKALTQPTLLAQLRDPTSRSRQQPADCRNPWRSLVPDYGVYVGICTHLGCVTRFRNLENDPPAGGFFCGCHGSWFDGAGRVLKNVPAAYNLPVPPATLLAPTMLRLGRSAADPAFTMASIERM